MPSFQAARERQRAHPVFAFSQLPSAHNNSYGRVAYFRVTFYVPLQSQGFKSQRKAEEMFQIKRD